MAAMRSGRGRMWAGVAGYVLLMAAVIGAMFYARQAALAEFSKPGSMDSWQAWREDVRRQQQEGSGTVQRRVPRSAEPPVYVLMRDYFGVSLGGAVLFSTLLYGVIAWLVTGALSSPAINESR